MALPRAVDAPASVRTHWTLGFVSPVVHGYYFGNLLAGVVDAAADGRVVAIQTYDAGMRFGRLGDASFQAPVAWDHVDAFIIAGEALSDAYLRALDRTGKPIILISPEKVDLSYPIVVPDNRGGVAAVVEHLVEHGHSRIAYVARTPAIADDAAREQAYREEMARRGMRQYDPLVVAWDRDDRETNAAATRRLLYGDEPPTALLCGTDVAALTLMDVLKGAGIVVPRDLAVVGFDDIEDAAVHQPSLSTVTQSFTLKGRIAGELAISVLNGSPVATGYHYAPVSLVKRESCGCLELHSGRLEAPSTGESVVDRFVPSFVKAAHYEGELTRFRRERLTAVGQRMLDLFTAVVAEPVTDATTGTDAPGGATPGGTAPGGATPGGTAPGGTAPDADAPDGSTPEVGVPDLAVSVASVAAQTLELASQPQSIMRIVALLRQFARLFAAEISAAQISAADLPLADRLRDLAHDLSMAIVEQQMRSRPPEHLHFQLQRKHYEITTDLLRRDNRDSRSLGWLSRTEIRAGCFAVWDRERGGPNERSNLRILGTYDEHGTFRAVGERCQVRSFPPAPLLDRIGDRPGELMYLLSVRFDGSDWGFLALIGPLETRDDTNMMEMFNHWAVMLTVALDQEHAVQEIQVSEERYALAVEAANDGLWDWDLATGVTYYSARWKSLLGHADDEIGTAVDEWLDRLHPTDRSVLNRLLAEQFDGTSSTLELECRMRASDGGYRWMLVRALSVRDADGRVIRMVGSMTDVTDRKSLEERLRHDALYDALTGLPNRTLFLDRLNHAIEEVEGVEEVERSSDDWFAVVFLDLNGFKFINDSLGHQVGDQVLVKVAQRLARQMRTNDTVSRFGGDEFVVLLKDLRSPEDLSAIVDRILAAVSTPLTLDGRAVTVSAAAGVAVSPTGYATADEYLRDADTAMYRAKAIGSGASVLFDESMHAGAMARLHLESDLLTAITEGQFELYFQPILDLATGRIVSLEALIRWNHPTRGLVPPAEFLPVAEVTGLSQQLGRWTIGEVSRCARRWRLAATAASGVTISVNVSNHQFWDPDLCSYLFRTLREHDVPSNMLVLEVTEGVIMDDQGRATELMRQLHDGGVALHVDDFGTGRSSLEMIHNFPVDALKIDRSFVSRIDSEARSRELVRVMIAMGHNLGIEVIAEGVETAGQATALDEIGCRYAQGYLFSRPVTASRVPDLLRPDRHTPGRHWPPDGHASDGHTPDRHTPDDPRRGETTNP